MSIEDLDDKLEKFFTRQDDHNKVMMGHINRIERGVYGEDLNDNPGLMARMKFAENGIKKLFNFKNRVMWISVGIVGAVTLLWKVGEFVIENI